MLAIPPERDWLAYCIDEALYVLAAGHERRDLQWAEKFQRDDEGDDLYGKIMADPRTGKPPTAKELGLLNAATG